MNTKVNYIPKESMCMKCKKIRQPCYLLKFNEMPVLNTINNGTIKIVNCTDFVKL